MAHAAAPVEASGLLSTVLVTIDNNQPHQVMAGFGATHVALVYEGIGDVLTPPLRAQAIDAVYRQVGLNLGNLEAALMETPGGWNQRRNDDADPFHINPSGFTSLNADAIKTHVIDLAEPLGFTDFFPGQKINLRWASPWLAELRQKDYARYLEEAAEQVVAEQIHWRDQYRLVPKYHMLFNEPLSGNNELRPGTTRDVVDIVKRTGTRLREAGFAEVKFVVPNEETVEQSYATTWAILADKEARQYIGAIGYHTYPYGSTYASIPNILRTSGAGRPSLEAIRIRQRLRDLARRYELPLWMTEVSHGEVDPLSFDALRGRAIHIHDELVYADAAAYFGMLNIWDSRSQHSHFGNNNLFSPENEGNIVFVDARAGTVHISGTGYAIGHYARWMKRGSVRVEATANDALLQVTAFRDDASTRLVVVLINNASGERTVEVDIQGLTLAAASLTGEQSTARAFWQAIAPGSPTGPNAFSIRLPALSITTVAASTTAQQ
jgi:O-glycosyl hydrolase